MPPIRTHAAALLRSPTTHRLVRCLLGCALAAIAARPGDRTTRPAQNTCR
jgi:hypothetical protein